MRRELIIVSGTLRPEAVDDSTGVPASGSSPPASEAPREEEVLRILLRYGLAINQDLSEELHHGVFPPDRIISAGITFQRGSITFQLVIWVFDAAALSLSKAAELR